MQHSDFFSEHDQYLNRLLMNYREQACCSSTAFLTETDLQNVFIVMIEQFLNEALYFDDFSTLCETLVGYISPSSGLLSREILVCLHQGAALSWYIRHKPRNSITILEDLLSYWHILKTQREGN